MAMSTKEGTVNEREQEVKKGETKVAETKIIEAKVDKTGVAKDKKSFVDGLKEIGGKAVGVVKKNWKPFVIGAGVAVATGTAVLFKMASGGDNDSDEIIDTDDYVEYDSVDDTIVDTEI